MALTLLEIAADSRRNFALIHFSRRNRLEVQVFRPGEYTTEDKMHAAETFLGGGTDFQTPMNAALELMENGFENADIVFVTDGVCSLPEDYIDFLCQRQSAYRFTVTGVLLDALRPDMAFSLERFCQKVYRTSQLLGDDIVRELIGQRV